MDIMVYNRKLLRLTGFHYDSFRKFPNIIWAFFWFFMGSFNICPMLYFLWNNSTNVYGTAEGLSVLPSFCITALKIVFYVKNMKVVGELIHDLQRNVNEKCRIRPNSEIFSDAEKHLKHLTSVFFVSLVSCILFYCLIPYIITLYIIFNNGDYIFETPLSVKFPFNIAYHPIFEIIFFICGSSVAFMAMEMITMDTLFVGLVIYIRAHFVDLNETISNLAHQDSKNEIEMYNSICSCIKYHKQIISYVARLQEAMSVTIFVQYLGSTLLLCMIIFQTTISTRIDNLPVYISFLSGCITQLFMYSFYGTLLTEEGLNVAHTIYSSFNWYEYTPKSRKLLLLFILRAQKPVKLTAMKFFDCSLTTFMKIYKTSMSALALLQSFAN